MRADQGAKQVKALEKAKAMTVAELREKLAGYPQDMPVMAAWEGVRSKILPENFTVEPIEKMGVFCVVIDVEDYGA